MSPVDRAGELSKLRDVLPEVLAHFELALLEAAAVLESVATRIPRAEFEAKFRKGEAEHGRDWLTWKSPADFDAAAREEIVDLVLYLAMRRARFSTAPAFLSNRDLGDEQA